MTSRMIKVTIVGLLYLAAMDTVPAADHRATWTGKPLDIAVRARGFGKASSADIRAVVQSAANQLWRYCPHTQLATIDVYHRADHPQTDLETVSGDRIAIGLAAQDTRWAQYSFQFAHEDHWCVVPAMPIFGWKRVYVKQLRCLPCEQWVAGGRLILRIRPGGSMPVGLTLTRRSAWH